MMLTPATLFRDLDRATQRAHAPVRRPAMDAYRRGDDVWVHVDMPGVTADTIEVSVERGVLSIQAQRNHHANDTDRRYISERGGGLIQRQVSLGDGLDTDGIEADYTDGVLTLRIPVAAKSQPRKIDVTSGRSAIATDALEAGAAEPETENAAAGV